jgi:hypothetical protein
MNFPAATNTSKRSSLPGYILACGFALAIGWGLRGQFGHERGAMIPGVLGALAVALASASPDKFNRIGKLCVAGGVGMAFGGALSYMYIAEAFSQPGYRIFCTFLLLFKGALWGGVAGAVLGAAMGSTQYRLRDASAVIGIIAIYALVAALFPARGLSHGDGTWGLAAGLFALLIWMRFVKRDRAAILVSTLCAIGFGLGFPLGTLACELGEQTGVVFDWWKVAELIWGFCGGTALGVAAFALDEDLEEPAKIQWGVGAWTSVAFAAWLVPMWNGLNVATYWVNERGAAPNWFIPTFMTAALAVLASGAILARRFHFKAGPRLTAFLFLTSIWSIFAFQFAKMAYPLGAEPQALYRTQITMAVIAIGVSGWAVLRGFSNNASKETPSKKSGAPK